jgi:protein-tyrosine phosphatase
VVAQLFEAPARLLHVFRRRAARDALRGRQPRFIVAVCFGNLCRSPMAAGVLRQELQSADVRIESAGLIGFNRRSPADAVATAARYGVDLADHRSRPLTADLARAADLIVVMEPEQQRQVRERFGRSMRDVIVLGDLDPEPAEARAIDDPIQQGPEVFEASYARIARCARELVSVLGSAAGT